MTFVPYAGTAPSVNALLGGHVTAAIADYRDVIAQMKAGKLRALATASRTRLEPVPDVPTVAESGYRDYEAEGWFGMVAEPAPGRLSTTIVRPCARPISSANSRANVSVGPPGGNGTTILTVLAV